MDKCFDMVNNQSKNITLTRESNKNNWLSFLNVKVSIANGSNRTRWNREFSIIDSDILVHCCSSHPIQAKQAVVRNIFGQRKGSGQVL